MNDVSAKTSPEVHALRAWRRLLWPGVIALLTGVSATAALAAAHAAAPGIPSPLLAGMTGSALACYWMARSAVEGSVILRTYAAPLDRPSRGPMAVLLGVATWSALSALIGVLSPWTARARRRALSSDDGAYTAAWRARMHLVTPAIVIEGARWRDAGGRSEDLMSRIWSTGQVPRIGTAAFLAGGGAILAFPAGAVLLWTTDAGVALVGCVLWLLVVDVVTMTFSAAARAELYTQARAAE